MILVCPACDAKFKVPDGAIPAAGRTVRCAKCKHSWHAKPTDIMRKRPAGPAQPAPARPAAPPRPAPPQMNEGVSSAAAAEAEALRQSVRSAVEEPVAADPPSVDEDMFEDGDKDVEPVSATRDDNDDFGISAAAREALGKEFDDMAPSADAGDGADDFDGDDYDEDDFLARRRADQRRQLERETALRRGRLVTTGWALLVVFWIVTFYAFVFERERMEYKFPGTKVLYSMFEGMSDKERFRPAEGEKLTPSPAEAEVYFSVNFDEKREYVVEGRRHVFLKGHVINQGTTGASVPQVLIKIVNANDRVLDQWVVNPKGLIVRRKGKALFETERALPPGGTNIHAEVIEGSRSNQSADAQS